MYVFVESTRIKSMEWCTFWNFSLPKPHIFWIFLDLILVDFVIKYITPFLKSTSWNYAMHNIFDFWVDQGWLLLVARAQTLSLSQKAPFSLTGFTKKRWESKRFNFSKFLVLFMIEILRYPINKSIFNNFESYKLD